MNNINLEGGNTPLLGAMESKGRDTPEREIRSLSRSDSEVSIDLSDFFNDDFKDVEFTSQDIVPSGTNGEPTVGERFELFFKKLFSCKINLNK